MSRRAKLLIAAIFLVLLAVLGAYLAIVWPPANPLRFRIAEPQEQLLQAKEPVPGEQWLVVIVENTCDTPIYLAGGGIHEPAKNDPQYFGMLMPTNQPLDHGFHAEGYFLIPPHGEIRCAVLAHSEFIPQLLSGASIMEYGWASDITSAVNQRINWLSENMPARMRPILPYRDNPRAETPLAAPTSTTGFPSL